MPAAFALAAAFLWAAYYFFVLGAGDTARSALLADPFLAGAAGYVAYALAVGNRRELATLFRDPIAYLRGGALVSMQLAVLASTYLAGAIDTALLSLVGDVVAVPIFLALLFNDGRDRFRSPLFVGGLAASCAGAALVIGGGASVEPLTGWAWVAAPLVPIFVAIYFLWSAQASRTIPMPAVLAQSVVVAGVLGVVISPVLPGGAAGLVPPNAIDLLLVVALGLTSFFVAPVLYFRAIERAGLVLPSILMTAIPVFTLLLDVVVFRFVPPAVSLLGIPIAVAGAFLAVRGPHDPWTPRYDDPVASGATPPGSSPPT